MMEAGSMEMGAGSGKQKGVASFPRKTDEGGDETHPLIPY